MRPLTVLHFYRVRLRARLVPELLALTGIAVGVALVFAAAVASTSLTASVRQLSEGIVGDADFQVSARSPAGFDQRLFQRMRGADGVAALAPVTEARANLAGPGGLRSVLLLGGDPLFARVGGALLRHNPAISRRVQPGLVLPQPLAAALSVHVGSRLRLETGAGVTRTRVVGQLDRSAIGSLAESPVALAPLRFVQEVAGMPERISRVFVEAEPGGRRVAEAALRRISGGRLDVGPADREVAIFERAAYPTNQSTALFSVLSALVGFLFALSAMLLTVPQRRRLIVDLRMAGYEPRLVVQLLLWDALALGVAGSLLGLAVGDQASRHLFGEVPGFLTSAFVIGPQRTVTWGSVAIAVSSGLLAACIAVLTPIRDAVSRRSRQAAAPSDASARGALTAAGFALLLFTVAIVVLWPGAVVAGIATLVLALLMLLPAAMRIAAGIFDRVGRRLRHPAAIFAALELRSGAARTRSLALVATGAIAIFATVAIGGARADLQRGLDAVAVETDSSADVWITFGGPANILGTTPFAVSPRQLDAVESAAGVRRVSRARGGFLDVGDRRAWVLAPPLSAAHPVPASQVQSGIASLADRRLRHGGWVVLSEDIAAALGVGVGDRVTLPTPVPTALRVAALTTNVGWPGGAVVINATDYARAWDTAAVTALGVEAARGTSPAAIQDSVEDALGRRSPLRVETRAERIHRQQAAARSGLARLSQIAATVLIAAILAMAASMGGMIWQRRPNLAVLKVHGVGELELWSSLLLESGLILGTGCFLGALFGLLGQVLLGRALEAITGFPVFYEPAVPIALQALVLVTAVAIAILAIPGWLAARVPPTVGATG